jgi:hypothetical protein
MWFHFRSVAASLSAFRLLQQQANGNGACPRGYRKVGVCCPFGKQAGGELLL